MKKILISLLTLYCFCGSIRSDSAVTLRDALTSTFRSALQHYAQQRNGQLPSTINDPEIIHDMGKYSDLFNPLSDHIIYFFSARPTWRESGMIAEGEIIAMSAYPIHEDRRSALGRYIELRLANGSFDSSWGDESKIQAALTKAGISVPTAPVFQEKPLLPASLEYATTLLEDALAHGVSRAEAGKVIDKHIEDALAGKAKTAKTWAEILPGASAQPSAAKGTQPVSAMHSPSPSDSSPAIKWLLLAAATLVAFALGWRLLRRK